MGPIQLGRAKYLPELMQARPLLLPYSTCTAYYNILLFFLFLSGLANSHFGNSPWVDQFGHCGQRSLALHVPSTFFNNLRGNLQRKCKKRWIRKPPQQRIFFVGILFPKIKDFFPAAHIAHTTSNHDKNAV